MQWSNLYAETHRIIPINSRFMNTDLNLVKCGEIYDQKKVPSHPESAPFIMQGGTRGQGLRASSLQFTSPLEFNAIFRYGFPLRVDLNG